MKQSVGRFCADVRGSTSIDQALIGCAVAVIVIAAIYALSPTYSTPCDLGSLRPANAIRFLNGEAECFAPRQ